MHLLCLAATLLLTALSPSLGLAADPAQAAIRRPGPVVEPPVAPAKPLVNQSGQSGQSGHGGQDGQELRVALKKSAPTEGTPRVGGAASFEARLYRGETELPQDAYECRWQADDGAKFLEAAGPFTNTAVFTRPGRQRVWVEVVPKSGPSAGLAAISEAVTLDIAQPSFGLSASPASPLVGEEVTVAIRDFPVHDGVEFRWDPLPGHAKLVRVGERSLTFYPTQAKTTPVKVTAVAADSGKSSAPLGLAKADVPVRTYAVTVDNRGLAEAPATVWRDGEGPVAADGAAVGQRVGLRASITPASPHLPLSYAWGLCPGARAAGGDDTREIAASRQETGPCPVSVEVRDARGLLLGRGQGAFEVAVSQAELDRAAERAREVARLVGEAGQAWTDGDPGRSAQAAGQAVRLSPKDPAAVANLERILRDKGRLDDHLARANAALAADDFDEAAAMLDAAAKINAKAAAITTARQAVAVRKDTLARIARLLAQARDKWEAGAVEEALGLTGKALESDPAHAGAKAERERLVAARDRLIAALKQSAAMLAAKRFDSAAKAVAEAKAVSPRFGAVAEMEAAIAARKQRAWSLDERLARARDQWNAGDADAALATVSEAAALDPEHPGAVQARKNLAQARDNLARAEDRAEAALARGKLDEARAALADAAKLNPRHPRIAQLQDAATHRAGRDQRLAALAAESAKRNAAGDLDGALLAVNDMLALVPGDAALAAERTKLARAKEAVADALARSRDFLAARRYDLALAALAEAEKINAKLPQLAQLRQNVQSEKTRAETELAGSLAQAGQLADQKNFAAARRVLDAARETGPLPQSLAGKAKDLERRIDAGRLQHEAAKREQDNRNKSAAATVDADRAGQCDSLGKQATAKRTSGDHAGAIRDYQALLTLCPDTCQAYNNVGTSLYSLGYAAESLPWFDEAVKCSPSEALFRENATLTRKRLATPATAAGDATTTCTAAFETAESRRGGGDLAGAVEGYKAVVTRCPDFCAAYNNLGLTLHKQGRTPEALPFFEQALRCNPRDTLFKENYELTVKRLRTAQVHP
ncbi:tetratricopeptide repeat protein [Desulfovibrio aerotolerans]|uniref:Tetratricopeptide repeat protein n=1 Tax=Solidesulfovibrio aerotolerans TaxID=295255 RepID=A0A7C9MJA1_9BACT|nr:tetratricopeptide repeat protein [Solidesulfovibrio aerotolerans]MYL83309.1 tetratricopeptide repeat protein [Solidesulfovibrio aerotolerans]